MNNNTLSEICLIGMVSVNDALLDIQEIAVINHQTDEWVMDRLLNYLNDGKRYKDAVDATEWDAAEKHFDEYKR